MEGCGWMDSFKLYSNIHLLNLTCSLLLFAYFYFTYCNLLLILLQPGAYNRPDRQDLLRSGSISCAIRPLVLLKRSDQVHTYTVTLVASLSFWRKPNNEWHSKFYLTATLSFSNQALFTYNSVTEWHLDLSLYSLVTVSHKFSTTQSELHPAAREVSASLILKLKREIPLK